MPINVYAWPPVGVKARRWFVQDPVAVLRSALTGREQLQASGRTRKLVSLEVSALSRGRLGGGYMEMLGRLLKGGVHAVRLSSWSPNWHVDADVKPGFEWLSLSLTATATTSAGLAAWSISGLPPLYPLIKPGERFTVGALVFQAVNEVVANAAGVATVRVLGTTEGSGAVTLNAQETAVFRPISIPSSPQTPGADFRYSWEFREVFADEVGGFTEIDPWI